MPKGAKFGGRQKGTPNKATAEVKEFAGQYTRQAILGLVKIAKTARSEQARVSAWREILDRAVGRPAQQIDLSNQDGSLSNMFAAAVRAANGLIEEAPEETGGTRTVN